MQTFNFNKDDARRYGVDEAIMLWHIRYWVEKNTADKRHFHDGRYWTYSSAEAFTKIFPFWSSGQIRRILKSLQAQGAILVGNYNSYAQDRTSWYALSDTYTEGSGDHFAKSKNASCENENCHFAETESSFCENERPLPDIIEANDKENISSSNEDNIQKKGTAESLCLFANSRFYDFEKFKECFTGEEYQNIDIAYYYESVKDWSSAGGKKKRDWIATARNFMRGDRDKGKLKMVSCGLPQSAIDYLKMGSDE